MHTLAKNIYIKFFKYAHSNKNTYFKNLKYGHSYKNIIM